MNKLGAIFFLLVAGTAHAAERLTTVQVSGLSVPGTQALGKAQGFTECVDFYTLSSCWGGSACHPWAKRYAQATEASRRMDVLESRGQYL